MDLPAKAICDLDYAFNGAIRDGYIQGNDPDVVALKGILQTLSQAGSIVLNPNTGLPKNSNIVSAAGAFELLANEPNAIPHIESVHNRMKSQGIWLWKRGAIEAHIGTTSKDESAWAQFKSAVIQNGLSSTCPDYQSVLDLIEWIRN